MPVLSDARNTQVSKRCMHENFIFVVPIFLTLKPTLIHQIMSAQAMSITLVPVAPVINRSPSSLKKW